MAAIMAMAQPSQFTQGSATLLNTLLSTYTLAAAAQSAIAKVTPPFPPSPSLCPFDIGLSQREASVDP